jgi:hypothetical protein
VIQVQVNNLHLRGRLAASRSRRLVTCGAATSGVIQVQVANLHLLRLFLVERDRG